MGAAGSQSRAGARGRTPEVSQHPSQLPPSLERSPRKVPTPAVPFLLWQFSSQNVISVTEAQRFSSLLLLAHPLECRDPRGRPPHTPRAADDVRNGMEEGGATVAPGWGKEGGSPSVQKP